MKREKRKIQNHQMKKNDLLDKFYQKRKSIIFRSFFFFLIIAFIITLSYKFQSDESFIAKINIEGIIQDRTDIIKQINSLKSDNNVKGLLTIINSPGGTYVGSKELYDSIQTIGEKIPTAVYMKEMATSGGYLASLSSDKIFGNSGSITGSIGVILQSADISNLLGKIGVSPIIIKSGKLKAVPNPAEQIDEEKLNYLKEIIEKMQKEFLMIVKKNRNVSESVLSLVSDGRILTGREAKNLKLIDDIGNEDDALNWLKNEAKVDEKIKIKELSPENDLQKLINLRIFKKKFNYFSQNFYNGFFAIWAPGL
ncbi:MAG: signal peptide peptidase SppA [Pelagibacteraceae bacterium TMED65]|nr:signal peptide peptidase SppA [Rickettsiales bacterium]OUU50347.1 MAG: signal peptide peptidase SppA [Pelagibacteraceae bacterium TMED65]